MSLSPSSAACLAEIPEHVCLCIQVLFFSTCVHAALRAMPPRRASDGYASELRRRPTAPRSNVRARVSAQAPAERRRVAARRRPRHRQRRAAPACVSAVLCGHAAVAQCMCKCFEEFGHFSASRFMSHNSRSQRVGTMLHASYIIYHTSYFIHIYHIIIHDRPEKSGCVSCIIHHTSYILYRM